MRCVHNTRSHNAQGDGTDRAQTLFERAKNRPVRCWRETVENSDGRNWCDKLRSKSVLIMHDGRPSSRGRNGGHTPLKLQILYSRVLIPFSSVITTSRLRKFVERDFSGFRLSLRARDTAAVFDGVSCRRFFQRFERYVRSNTFKMFKCELYVVQLMIISPVFVIRFFGARS